MHPVAKTRYTTADEIRNLLLNISICKQRIDQSNKRHRIMLSEKLILSKYSWSYKCSNISRSQSYINPAPSMLPNTLQILINTDFVTEGMNQLAHKSFADYRQGQKIMLESQNQVRATGRLCIPLMCEQITNFNSLKTGKAEDTLQLCLLQFVCEKRSPFTQHLDRLTFTNHYDALFFL